MNNRKTNTLVVGQGIAGSLVAFMLYRNKVPFVVMDPAVGQTSSMVAAGMFTPVTGKRKTTQPEILQQISFALMVYKELEVLLGIQLLQVQDIFHVFNSQSERDELASKIVDQPFSSLMQLDPETLPQLKQEFGAALISASGWVDCATFIESFRAWLKELDAWIGEAFDHNTLNASASPMQYDQLQFENIIFCEGYLGKENPFFQSENIIPCKGDVLTIGCSNLPQNFIIKKAGVYMIETGNGKAKVGATYRWNNDLQIPDEDSRKELEKKLDDLLVSGYTVTNHQTGIRPTTKNREVIARQHNIYKNMYMLNGLGTKGILQGPWWANFLVEKYFMNDPVK